MGCCGGVFHYWDGIDSFWTFGLVGGGETGWEVSDKEFVVILILGILTFMTVIALIRHVECWIRAWRGKAHGGSQ